jgi:hypothetical protein
MEQQSCGKLRAQSRMLRLGSMPFLGNLKIALEDAHFSWSGVITFMYLTPEQQVL